MKAKSLVLIMSYSNHHVSRAEFFLNWHFPKWDIRKIYGNLEIKKFTSKDLSLIEELLVQAVQHVDNTDTCICSAKQRQQRIRFLNTWRCVAMILMSIKKQLGSDSNSFSCVPNWLSEDEDEKPVGTREEYVETKLPLY